jgi:hypothetical protein
MKSPYEHSQWRSQIFIQNDFSKLTLSTLTNEFLHTPISYKYIIFYYFIRIVFFINILFFNFWEKIDLKREIV